VLSVVNHFLPFQCRTWPANGHWALKACADHGVDLRNHDGGCTWVSATAATEAAPLAPEEPITARASPRRRDSRRTP
jgi:hypothetical protein